MHDHSSTNLKHFISFKKKKTWTAKPFILILEELFQAIKFWTRNYFPWYIDHCLLASCYLQLCCDSSSFHLYMFFCLLPCQIKQQKADCLPLGLVILGEHWALCSVPQPTQSRCDRGCNVLRVCLLLRNP